MVLQDYDLTQLYTTLSCSATMAERPQFKVSNLRKWLQNVQKRLSQTEWILLLLSYYDNFPFGKLENLNDPADLYNQLADSETFSSTEAFQLLLNCLALLNKSGKACIDLLQDPNYELSQPESCPDLERKLSQESKLMEAVVAALVALTPRKRDRLIKYLGTTQLEFHEDWCTLFRVVSELRQRHIITAKETQVFVEALKHVRAPRTAIDRLWLYHNKYELDLECFGEL